MLNKALLMMTARAQPATKRSSYGQVQCKQHVHRPAAIASWYAAVEPAQHVAEQYEGMLDQEHSISGNGAFAEASILTRSLYHTATAHSTVLQAAEQRGRRCVVTPVREAPADHTQQQYSSVESRQQRGFLGCLSCARASAIDVQASSQICASADKQNAYRTVLQAAEQRGRRFRGFSRCCWVSRHKYLVIRTLVCLFGAP